MDFFLDNFFNLIGIASFIIGILAYSDGRTSKKQAKKDKDINAYIHSIAAKNLTVDITEEQIKELESYKSNLQDIIDNKLPLVAKRNDLLSRVELYKDQIIKNYVEYDKLCCELNEMEEIELPQHIIDIVSTKLLPEEVKRKEREKNIVLLASIFVMYVIVDNIPLINKTSIFFLIFAYKPLSTIMEISITGIQNIKKKVSYFFNFVIGFYVFLYSYAVLNSFDKYYHNMGVGKIIAFDFNINVIMSFILTIISYIWFVSSLVLLIKDFVIFSKYNIIKGKKLVWYIIFYITTFLMFCDGVFMILQCDIQIGRNVIEIYNNYTQFQLAIALIFLSICVMVIVPLKLKRNN